MAAPIFPGMDPYLEAPARWAGFHDAFLAYTRETLQPILPEGYYAELRTREEIGVAGLGPERVIYPNVAVRKPAAAGAGDDGGERGGSVVAATVPEHLVVLEDEPLPVSFLEIRDTMRSGNLVTLIEVLSPSNKCPGQDRERFIAKQQEVFRSDTHWIEIDLLRSGARIAGHPSVAAHCNARGYDYVVVVSRSSRRSPKLDLETYGFTVRDPLPVISVPLVDPTPDVLLDLGHVFRRAYETGPYRKIMRYDEAPEPPLKQDAAAWAEELLRRKGVTARPT